VEGVPIWSLEASNGTTLVRFDGDYRYELFGRSFVAGKALEQMALSLSPLADVEGAAG
jgi:hypothetical protein